MGHYVWRIACRGRIKVDFGLMSTFQHISVKKHLLRFDKIFLLEEYHTNIKIGNKYLIWEMENDIIKPRYSRTNQSPAMAHEQGVIAGRQQI